MEPEPEPRVSPSLSLSLGLIATTAIMLRCLPFYVRGLTYNLTKCLKCFASNAACRLPSLQNLLLKAFWGTKLETNFSFLLRLLLLPIRSAEIKYYVPLSCPPACCTANCRQQFGEKRQRGILYHQCAATSQTSLHFTHLRSPHFSRTHLYKAQINIWNSKLKLTHTHTQRTHTCAVCIVEYCFASEKRENVAASSLKNNWKLAK